MVQVTYQGGGMDGVTSNAASEATLQLLLKALSGQGGAGSGAQDAYNKAQKAGTLNQKLSNTATAAGTKATQAGTSATKAGTKAMKKFGSALKSIGGGLVAGLGNVAGTATNLSKELVMGGNRLSDFGQHLTGLLSTIPIVGGAIGGVGQMFLNIIDAQIDTFRDLSNTGVDFGGSLFDVQQKATQTGLSLEIFAGAISEGSANLAQMFGGATQGARMFTELQRNLKDTVPQLMKLGVSMEDIGEFTNDYLEIQKISGRYQGMTARQLAKGTTDYIKQLDGLAKVTGMSRKQAAEALRAQANDKRLQALYQSIDDGTRKSIDGVLAAVGNASPELKEGLTELIATGGVPISDYAKGLMMQMPEVAEAAKQLKDGSISQDEFIKVMQGASARMQDELEAQGGNISTYKALGVGIFDAMLDVAKIGEIAGDSKQAMEDQKKAIESGEKGLAAFESTITNLRNLILGTLIESGVFKEVEAVIADFGAYFSGNGGGVQKLKDGIGVLADFLRKLVDDIKTFGLKETFMKYVIEPIKRMFTGESEGDKKERLTKDYDKRIASVDGSTPEGKEKIAKLKADKDKALAEAGKEGDKGGLFANLMPDIGFKELAIGIGLVTAAVAAIGLAGTLASPGLLLVATAFAGIGVAGFGLAALVESITTGVDKLAEGVKKFEDLDSTKLTNVGEGLSVLTGPIMDLAKGGIVANFIGTGAFTNLANGIREFENINPANLHAVGPALTSLHKGMSAFTGDGVLDSIGKALGSLFGGSSGSISDLAKDVKEFADVDAQGLKAIGDGLQGIANFIEAMDGANLRTVSKSLSELTKQLTKYQEEYSKMDSETKANLVSNFTSFGEGQKGAADKLDQLNSSVQMMLVELRKQTRSSNIIADSTV
tara:strand:- start:939 stop:3596 length:2658 start_codon:yes stop_codon:yes gene_type:complete